MKKYLAFIALFCAGCVSEPQKIETPLGQTLENKKDLIATIEAYNNKYKGCRCLNSSIFCNGDNRSWDKCDTSLRRTDVNYRCFETVGNGYVKYTDETDECILHRRDIKESPIQFFDFKRFIPEGTAIKTDQAFEKIADFYALGVYTCNNFDETTTDEKEQCKSKVKDLAIQISQNKVIKCNKMEVFKEEYKQFIVDVRSMILLGQSASLKQSLLDYMQTHLCDLSDYLEDAGFEKPKAQKGKK